MHDVALNKQLVARIVGREGSKRKYQIVLRISTTRGQLRIASRGASNRYAGPRTSRFLVPEHAVVDSNAAQADEPSPECMVQHVLAASAEQACQTHKFKTPATFCMRLIEQQSTPEEPKHKTSSEQFARTAQALRMVPSPVHRTSQRMRSKRSCAPSLQTKRDRQNFRATKLELVPHAADQWNSPMALTGLLKFHRTH